MLNTEVKVVPVKGYHLSLPCPLSLNIVLLNLSEEECGLTIVMYRDTNEGRVIYRMSPLEVFSVSKINNVKNYIDEFIEYRFFDTTDDLNVFREAFYPIIHAYKCEKNEEEYCEKFGENYLERVEYSKQFAVNISFNTVIAISSMPNENGFDFEIRSTIATGFPPIVDGNIWRYPRRNRFDAPDALRFSFHNNDLSQIMESIKSPWSKIHMEISKFVAKLIHGDGDEYKALEPHILHPYIPAYEEEEEKVVKRPNYLEERDTRYRNVRIIR